MIYKNVSFIFFLTLLISCATQETTTTVAPSTTTTTVAPSTTTVASSIDVNCGNLADSPFVDDEKIRVFAASDLNQETVNSTLEFTNEAYDLWMSEEYYGICQAKAIYLMITGSDIDAGRKANQEFCDFLKDMKYKSAEWCSNDTSDGYVRNGGAGINSNGPVEGFYFMVMGPRGNNFGNSYKTMAYHEVIHIYQISNIYSRTWDEADTKMGKRTGDDPNIDVAWWAEGNADFLAALYTSDTFDDFRSKMRDPLESTGPFGISRKQKYFDKTINSVLLNKPIPTKTLCIFSVSFNYYTYFFRSSNCTRFTKSSFYIVYVKIFKN